MTWAATGGKSNRIFGHFIAVPIEECGSGIVRCKIVCVSAILKIAVVAFIGFRFASAQGTGTTKSQIETTPRFEDYPIAEIFHGTPAPPLLVTQDERMFRTRIRDGVTKGEGVWRDEKEQPGPNFAGRYIVVTWACGSPCGMMAIEDATTGKVYKPPISEGFMLPSVQPDDPNVKLWGITEPEFRLNSRLMIVNANPDPSQGRINYVHYFLWENNQWRLLRRMSMKPTER
jgi:hypothetical protein